MLGGKIAASWAAAALPSMSGSEAAACVVPGMCPQSCPVPAPSAQRM